MEPMHTGVRTTATSKQEQRMKVEAGKRKLLRKYVRKSKKKGYQ